MDIVYEETLSTSTTPLHSKPITVHRKPIKSKPTKKKTMRIGKFEIYKDKANDYRFRLKASNGEIIAVSEGYHSKKSCINGIQSVKRNVQKPKIIVLKK